MMRLLVAVYLAGPMGLLSLDVQAQEPTYRCGWEYTNAVPQGNPQKCKLISGGDAHIETAALGNPLPTKNQLAQLARELEGTIFVIPHRESADGVLTACGLEFAAVKGDYSTQQGAPVKIAGSFNLRQTEKIGLAYALKLGAFDGIGTESESGFAPANAFIRAPNGITPKRTIRADAEDDGFALFVGALDKDALAAFSGIAEKSQLVVGFNRKPGQQDLIFNLDLTVIDTQIGDSGKVVRKRSTRPVIEFVACSLDLMKAAQKKLK
jgi:hypothetical protein